MHPTTALLAGLLAQSVAAGPTACLTKMIVDPTDRCHSAQSSDIKTCLHELLDNITQETLQACFEKAGCDTLDAKSEAQLVVESCFGETELRRRQDEDDDNNSSDNNSDNNSDNEKDTGNNKTVTEEEEETTTSRKTTTTSEAKVTAAEEPEQTEENNPVETAVETRTVQQSNPAPNPAAASTVAGAAAQADLASVTSPSQCYTTITFTTEGWDIIATNSAGRVSRSFNSQKLGTKTRCADGLVCRSEGCMVADNSLRGSGIAVAIFFGASAAVAFVTLIFLCCRDRRNDKKLRAKMEAAKIAKENAKPVVVAGAGARSISAGRRSPSGADRQPLMNQGGMYPSSPGGSQSGRPSHDPFGDQRRA